MPTKAMTLNGSTGNPNWEGRGFKCEAAGGTLTVEFDGNEQFIMAAGSILNWWRTRTINSITSTVPNDQVVMTYLDGFVNNAPPAPASTVSILNPLGRRADAASMSTALSIEDVELLAPAFQNIAWLPLANRAGALGQAYAITLNPPAWAVGVNFWLFCDSTIAGVPALDVVTQGDFGATTANDMIVFQMAASPANQQVLAQMRPALPGTLAAPSSVVYNANRTTVTANAGLPASLTLGVRYRVAGTVKFQTGYSWMR